MGVDSSDDERQLKRVTADDDDFQSQPSILKWVRHFPGPLHDVMKKENDRMGSVNGEDRSDEGSGWNARSAAAISTMFDDGPWVEMCQYLGIATSPGKLYGGVRISSLKYTLSYILEDDKSSPKIPQDPTGEIEGYFHRDIVEQLGPAFSAGVGVILRNVSVFTPTETKTVGGRRKSYLNIVPRNLQRVVLVKGESSTYDTAVTQFNEEREQATEQEKLNEQEEQQQQQIIPLAVEQRLLQHDAVRNASTELSYISQRQVVHRNPPVRNTEGVTAPASKGKRKKTANSKSEATGLGRWQWNQLLQQKNSDSTASARSPKNRKRSINDDTLEEDKDEDSGPDTKKKTSSKVQFAPLSQFREDQNEMAEITASQSSPGSRLLFSPTPESRPSSAIKRASTNSLPSQHATLEKEAVVVDEDDEEDDDDDW